MSKKEIDELLEEISRRIGRKVTSPEEVEDFEVYKAEIELQKRWERGEKEN